MQIVPPTGGEGEVEHRRAGRCLRRGDGLKGSWKTSALNSTRTTIAVNQPLPLHHHHHHHSSPLITPSLICCGLLSFAAPLALLTIPTAPPSIPDASMPITVQNITSTSAMVSWPLAPGCLDTFYSIMYHPNWNSLLMGYTRKSFMREHHVPVSQTTTLLGNLSPQTTYILCVTCQSAVAGSSAREQCQVFNTLDDASEMGGAAGARRDLAMGVWLASSLLLLVIAVVLLWGCLYSMCPGQGQGQGQGQRHPGEEGNCPALCSLHPGQTLVSGGGGGGGEGGGGGGGSIGDIRNSSFYTPSCSEEEEEEEENTQQATVLAHPFHMGDGVDAQGHELGSLAKQSNGGPN